MLSVREGCPNAGYGVVGGEGLRKPLPPAARRAGDHARTPGRRRKPATGKKRKNDNQPAAQATTPGRRADAASQRPERKGKNDNQPAAQATTPGRRADAASQRLEKKKTGIRPLPLLAA